MSEDDLTPIAEFYKSFPSSGYRENIPTRKARRERLDGSTSQGPRARDDLTDELFRKRIVGEGGRSLVYDKVGRVVSLDESRSGSRAGQSSNVGSIGAFIRYNSRNLVGLTRPKGLAVSVVSSSTWISRKVSTHSSQ